jgi:hypothetical protein
MTAKPTSVRAAGSGAATAESRDAESTACVASVLKLPKLRPEAEALKFELSVKETSAAANPYKAVTMADCNPPACLMPAAVWDHCYG